MNRTPLSRNPISRPTPFEEATDRKSPSEVTATREAAAAFDKDWEERAEIIRNSPITAFLKAHELAGSPNELTITGVADVKVSLGDLRQLMRAVE